MNQSTLRHAAAAYLVTLGLVSGVFAQCDPVEIQKLLASDGHSGSMFGLSLSASGDTAVVGSPLKWGREHSEGAAYVYRWDGSAWAEQQKLVASDAARADHFGLSVSIRGDVILVGAYRNDDNGENSGSAYVFRYDGSRWREEQKLTASDAAERDWFGTTVSIDGDTAVVGSIWGDRRFADTGAAYVFRWNGSRWVEEQKLVASDGADGDQFYRVAQSRDRHGFPVGDLVRELAVVEWSRLAANMRHDSQHH